MLEFLHVVKDAIAHKGSRKLVIKSSAEIICRKKSAFTKFVVP